MSSYLAMCIYELQNAILVLIIYRMYGMLAAAAVLVAMGVM